MGENQTLSWVRVVSESKAMLDTTFGVGANERGKAANEQLPQIAFTLLEAKLLFV